MISYQTKNKQNRGLVIGFLKIISDINNANSNTNSNYFCYFFSILTHFFIFIIFVFSENRFEELYWWFFFDFSFFFLFSFSLIDQHLFVLDLFFSLHSCFLERCFHIVNLFILLISNQSISIHNHSF